MKQIRLTRTTTQQASPGGPLDDPFTASAETAGLATITHGPYGEPVPIAGLTVGTIRRRFRDRYNLPADGLGMLDGAAVDDDTVVREGQVLTFMHRANSKGTGESPAPTPATVPAVVVEGNTLVVTLPEGRQARAPLVEVVPALAPRWLGDCIWPDGVKLVCEMSRGAIVVHQTPPRVHNLHWIAADSEADFGARTKYRNVRVALPYVIVAAVYRVAKTGRLELSGANECFFANKPLSSTADPLAYPALLNVSKMSRRGKEVPLAWICTQHLNRSFQKIAAVGERSRAGLQELLHHLFVDKFNRSSENHEGASWFGETIQAGVDKRLSSIE
ncbi:MAG: hypothetical protein ACYTGO_05835, partial [Planctomycetota bacterium]